MLNLAGLRSNILKLHYNDQASPQQRSYASALSGGVAGGGVTKLMGIFAAHASRVTVEEPGLLTDRHRWPSRPRGCGVLSAGVYRPEVVQRN